MDRGGTRALVVATTQLGLDDRGAEPGGSIAFGVSAVASHVVPASDQPRNVTLMNLGTFVGALCFLIGAVLLLPERTQGDARTTPQPRTGR